MEYTGTALAEKPGTYVKELGDTSVDRNVEVYLPDAALIQAVNLALHLKRPLLLMGEPGCGKTRLAISVAYDLYREKLDQHFFSWYVKSTSKAQDGIFTFDHLARLRASQYETQAERTYEQNLQGEARLQHFQEKGYLRKGELARAIDASTAAQPSILLIDEVDKADIDFPNDLLLELADNSYQIELTQTLTEKKRADAPLIIITSNNEKELPPAFLRRCLFHYIQFPSTDRLQEILSAHFPDDSAELMDLSSQAFVLVRDRLIKGLAQKKLSTSELIDWFKALQGHHNRQLTINGESVPQALQSTIQALGANESRVRIPLHQVLLKNWESILSLLPKDAYAPNA
jgi:MoxR-like ATPase